MTLPWFTDEELDFMCDGLKRSSNAARIRHLQGLGLKVDQKPNGKPLVWRPVPVEEKSVPRAATGINMAGLEEWYARRALRLQEKKRR